MLNSKKGVIYLAKYLVNWIDRRTGQVVPMGEAYNEADLQALKERGNSLKLNNYGDYEVIKNPDEEDMKLVYEMGKEITDSLQRRNEYMDISKIYKQYDAGEISGTEARRMIEDVLADAEPERVESAIRELYADRHTVDDYDGYYDDEDEEAGEDNYC